MAIAPFILLLFVLVFVVYKKRKIVLTRTGDINRLMLLLLLFLLIILIIWMAFMVFNVGPAMRNM
ncbi:MAG: hypothetical protein JJU37_12310 [Balneolaceae bacterium]|nr:hypothetical protein [Balneolaceae bacterium]